MKFSSQIKSISYLKSNAAEIMQELTKTQQAMIITQNGEAKAVIQDVESYEQTQEILALLKVLALGNQQIESDQTVLANKAIKDLRKKYPRK